MLSARSLAVGAVEIATKQTLSAVIGAPCLIDTIDSHLNRIGPLEPDHLPGPLSSPRHENKITPTILRLSHFYAALHRRPIGANNG